MGRDPIVISLFAPYGDFPGKKGVVEYLEILLDGASGNLRVGGDGLVYAFDPIQGLSPEFCGKVVGGQCNNWAEFTYDGKDLEWKLWPRGLAIAEVLWTYPDPKKRDFADFKRRAAVRRDEMVSRGVNAAPVN